MTLPVPNLDDRRFQDIVDEAKRMIPSLCPEWTNHNVSDPGVALIELFAWMTEMTLFRLNQVPDKFYTHMLNLVGFEPFPPSAARADLTFWTVGGGLDVTIPAGTEVATLGNDADSAAQVFATLENAVVRQPNLVGALAGQGENAYLDAWDALRYPGSAAVCFPRLPLTPGDAFLLGFDRSLAGQAIQLRVSANIEGIGVLPHEPPLVWEIWQGEGWIPMAVHEDSTGGLNRDGIIVLLAPQAHEPLTLLTKRAWWIRARLLPGDERRPTYRQSPQISALTATSIGVTVTAEHSRHVPAGHVGASSGRPNQAFTLPNSPLLPRSARERVIVTDPDGTAHEWDEVPDFINSGPRDRHVMWDSTTGVITFGPQIRYPDGSTRQHGAIPAEGAQITVSGYRVGGGTAGNVGARTITALRSSLPYIRHVENAEPARGGVDAETVENARQRGPHTLRAGARAVTASDFERLTAQADAGIARVRCLPPVAGGDAIRVLVVPSLDEHLREPQLDDFALPPAMIERVSTYLDERRLLGSTIEIGTPYYQGVTVAALVTARPGRPVTMVRERITDALYRLINPLTGGQDGGGWPFDTDLNTASLYQLIEAIEGVERVDEVLLFEYDLRNGERIGAGRELIRLQPDSLFCSARHQVVVR